MDFYGVNTFHVNTRYVNDLYMAIYVAFLPRFLDTKYPGGNKSLQDFL